MYVDWLVVIVINFLSGFILLYPFYLQNNRPARYRGIWTNIGSLLRNRYGSVWVLSLIFGGSVFHLSSLYISSIFVYFMVMIIYFIFCGMILWYPFYLKYRIPGHYTGLWKSFGEWMGDPLFLLHNSKD